MFSLTALVLAACGSDQGSGDDIELVYVAWDSEIASTNVISQVLEEAGYEVTMTQVEQGPMWSSVATGDADGFVAAWLPNDMASSYEEYGDEMVELGANLEGAITGLAVPTYMEDVNSIEDLTPEHIDSITGIDGGAGVMMATEQVISDYELDIELTASSDAIMTAALGDSYENQEPIVVTAWQPHWMFNTYDLKFLDDPKGVYESEGEIRTMVREGLEEDKPGAYQILSNFYWEPDDMNEIMLEISQDGVAPEEAAANWIESNRDKVDEWLEGAE
ncbi:glycine betaine ABC transporter substrate-binding protein [Alkalicoccobacillus murimartini]|uniref:Glycine betaine/proline transport system substrate-binding protein n=1 Tax=Alkalicoccobacillus murimartini TaxID=171685 RepID=A0ABT9YKS3_9BACI|nr:glycine betaine ABC transporter substrate-binding protein [Alkalicoccobacillus murimartini]MDQ0208473.1 glycine betaine/proline transport system substrate-binding protein [Alkalicoccobacillus murimartini]